MLCLATSTENIVTINFVKDDIPVIPSMVNTINMGRFYYS